MKAAILSSFGKRLSVEDVADPIIGTGEVLVDIAAAPVLSYAVEVCCRPPWCQAAAPSAGFAR
jgi:alcohol dehydrogenase